MKNTYKKCVSGLYLLSSLYCFGEKGDMPVAPIPPREFRGITNIIVLQNSVVTAAIHPQIGRLFHLGFQGSENIFRCDLDALRSSASGQGSWRNYGGEWLWPVAQSQWAEFFGKDWPPPPVLDDLLWKCTAWETYDGTQNCLLTLSIDAPLFIHIRRLIQLPPDQAGLLVRQRIERFGESSVPVTLWNISQIGGAKNIFFPVDARGPTRMAFDLPPNTAMTNCDDLCVFDAEHGTEHKLCSDSPRGWIAAQKDQQLMIQRAVETVSDATYPDSGCRIEMYSNRGLGYTEIETLSAEKVLRIGDVLENEIHLQCHRIPSPLSPCDLTSFARQQLGEIPALSVSNNQQDRSGQ